MRKLGLTSLLFSVVHLPEIGPTAKSLFKNSVRSCREYGVLKLNMP